MIIGKNYIIIFFIFFNTIFPVLGVSISNCNSPGQSNWFCNINDFCTCWISDCTDGDLLVYLEDPREILCSPEISGSSVDISWSDCGNPTGKVKIKVDCVEGQSTEKEINLIFYQQPQTTTTIFITPAYCYYSCQNTCIDDNNPPFCYKRIPHGQAGCPGGLICCESVEKKCPEVSTTTTIPYKIKTCPYECCIDLPQYEYKECPYGLVCCNNLCKETCGPVKKDFNILYSVIFWVILASLLPIIAFLIFIWKKNSDSKIPEY
ncbi:MAG: hypothetical protein QXY45_03795 [Candidatus Aenigmatarchaeota archaeon]